MNRMNPDHEVRSDLAWRLLQDEDVGSREIDITVEDGAVTLEGEVDGFADKARAQEIAAATPGCTRIDNRLRVAHPESTTDPDLEDEVRQALGGGCGACRHRVVVEVIGGRAVLRGFVMDERERVRVEDAARSVSGVRDVSNLLVADWLRAVRATALSGFLERKIRTWLPRRATDRGANVVVSNWGTLVELSGTVPEEGLRDTLARKVKRFRFRRVINRVRVSAPDNGGPVAA